jgi:hypothetical protein
MLARMGRPRHDRSGPPSATHGVEDLHAGNVPKGQPNVTERTVRAPTKGPIASST